MCEGQPLRPEYWPQLPGNIGKLLYTHLLQRPDPDDKLLLKLHNLNTKDVYSENARSLFQFCKPGTARLGTYDWADLADRDASQGSLAHILRLINLHCTQS